MNCYVFDEYNLITILHTSNILVGTNINPVLYQLVLWDTVTNEVITEDHPPGFDEKDFFRPTMLPYDDSSFLLLTADVADANGDVEQLQNVWQV